MTGPSVVPATPARRLNARGRRTTEAIEQAALEASAVLSVPRITVGDICTRAGVSERVFFNHFATREDAFLGRDRPRVDEDWAGRLMSDSSIPLLLGATRLVVLPAVDPRTRSRRLELTAADPALLARAYALLLPVRVRCVEIVAAAVASRRPELTPSAVDRVARILVAAASEMLDFEADESVIDALQEIVAESSRPVV